MVVCIFCYWLYLLRQVYLLVSFFPAIPCYLQRVCFWIKSLMKFIGLPTGYTHRFGWQHIAIIIMIIIASILGNIVGYWFGRKTGPLLYERRETLLFKRKHLVRATDFYNKYGKGTIFLAKFLPIVRTFAPIVAGIVKMHRPAVYVL